MAATIVGAFEPEVQNAVKTSKILLVGAGGIGCEVLKNLVLMGFAELEVIDLDTIEISNLNRQFLFNKESVGKPKSHVAKESVLRFNPNVNINSHFGDIMDKKYGTAFFHKFKLVINALDNKRARSHVNRMCLSGDIPLIESGTMGYSGQVEFIKKGFSLCYECFPKPELKEYPMCTIRNTPKEPIHCIIWAKFLFGQLFGEDSEEDVSMEETEEDGIQKLSARDWAKLNNYDTQKLFKKIFYDDVDYLLNMPDLYASKNIKPVKLDCVYLSEFKSDYVHEPENKVLCLSQYVAMFMDSTQAIKMKLQKSNGSLIWDKEDDDSMNFVVSCTNIRSAIFGIKLMSHFDIKSMAGNIIPAIPTANAIIAGQIVIHALRVLRGRYARCQTVFLRSMPNHKGGILVKDREVQKPNPKCMVCSTQGVILLSTDVYTFTVRQFEDLVLKQKLNIVAPDVLADGRMIISSDEEDELDFYSKTLFQADIIQGSKLVVEDFLQNYRVQMIVRHKIRASEEDPEFEVYGNVEDVKKVENKNVPKKEESEDDDFCLIDENKSISEEVKVGKIEETNIVATDEKNAEAKAVDDGLAMNGEIEKVVETCTVNENGNLTKCNIASSSDEGKSVSVTENKEASIKDGVSISDDIEVKDVENKTEENHENDINKLTEMHEDDENNKTILAQKRKAEDEEDEDISETKKSRQSTNE